MAETEGRGVIQRVRMMLDRTAAAQAVADAKRVGNEMGGALGEGARSVAPSFVSAFDRIRAAGQRTAAAIGDGFKKTSDGIGKYFNDTAKGMLVAWATSAVFSGIKNGIRDLATLGMTAQETESKFVTVFGGMSRAAQEWIDRNAAVLGMNNTVAREFLATIGAIGQGFGLSQRGAADFGKQIATMAGDLQSFHNVPIEETFGAIKSALSGAWEPMQRFGIVLRQDAVDARAMAMAHKETKESLTQQEKAMATLALLQERMGVANGDAVRTQGSVTNQLRRAKAEYENFKILLGTELVPVLAAMVGWLRDNQTELTTLAKVVVGVVGTALKGFWQAMTVLGDVIVIAGLVPLGLLAAATSTVGSAFALAAEGAAKFFSIIGATDTAASIGAWAERMRSGANEIGHFANGAMAQAGESAREAWTNLNTSTVFAPGSGVQRALPGAGNVDATLGPPEQESAKAAKAREAREARDERARQAQERKAAGDRAREMRHEAKDDAAEREAWDAIQRRAGVGGGPPLAGVGDAEQRAFEHGVVGGAGGIASDVEKDLAAMERAAREQATRVGDVMKLMLENVGDVSRNVSADMVDAFGSAFQELTKGAGHVGRFFTILGQGLAKSVLGEIGRIAKGKATENLAWAVEAGAHALMALARGDVASASIFGSSALQFAAAAAKWGFASAAIGAVGGGGGAVRTAGGNYGGRQVSDADRTGPDIVVYVDPFDKYNARHQDQIGEAADRYRERTGGSIRYVTPGGA